MAISNSLAGRFWPWLLLAVFGGLIIVRMQLVRRVIGGYVDCVDCFDQAVISSDMWLLAAIALLLLAASFISRHRARVLVQILISLVLVLYLADLLIFKLFGIRLFFVDLQIYGLEPAIVWEQASEFLGGPLLAAAVVIAALVALLLISWLPVRLSGRHRGLLVFCIAAALAAAALPAKPEYVNRWAYQNFLQANLITTESTPYSEEYANRQLQHYAESFPTHCIQGRQEQRNVILLILESWSMYHSRFFSGINDWTPELDKIAGQHAHFNNFYAGGFSTSEGLVYLLGGVRLWAPFHHLFEAASFDYAWNIDNSIARVFNQAGYHTAFLTTGPLSFVNKGQWLENLGFSEVEGNEHPFYRDFKKVSFHAAADQALYTRALDWIGQTREPYLLTLETVSTHQPYVDPDSGDKSLEKAIRYMDREAGVFYRALLESGYFDNGILLLVSDHRSMNPVTTTEQQLYGQHARSKVPMVLVDLQQPQPAPVTQLLHQADLRPSFEQWLNAEVCLEGLENSIFDPRQKPGQCALHAVGAVRGVVDVLCPGASGQVRLDGDDTQFINGQLQGPLQKKILAAIAAERLAGLRRHQQHSKEQNLD